MLKAEYKFSRFLVELPSEAFRCAGQVENGSLGMSLCPIFPGSDDRGDDGELFTFQCPVLAGPKYVTPKGLGFQVLHNKAPVPKHSRDTEIKAFALHLGGIHDAVKAKMSPCCCQRHTVESIVDDFPLRACQHVDWICS